MARRYVELDETPISYLEPGAGRSMKGYLWTGSRPGGDVFFDWHASRAAEYLDTVVPMDFQDTVQCDGYDGSRSTITSSKNAIRPTALGKSCRRRGIDPYAYLKNVLTRLPGMTIRQVPQILPAVWGKQPQSLPKAS